ncbi:MAG TPA: BTAD domain-containing putative transcriptional regulator, partial [Burkholderiales bacterium]|nr:BTAD domain-containing putative transcriptional regulator [Burkholderiales bacterium]
LRDPGNDALDRWLARAEPPAGTNDAQAGSGILLELALGRAMIAVFRGDFAASEAIIGILRPMTEAQQADARILTGMASAVGHLLDGSNAEALRTARECLGFAESEGIHPYDEWLRVMAAVAALGADDRDTARGELQALEASGARLRRGGQVFIHYLRGWLATLEDDAANAGRETKMALAGAVELGIPWLECLARIAWAQALSSDGDERGAEAQLRSAAAIANQVRSPLLDVSTHLAAAGVANRALDEHSALGSLRKGFALGRKHGLRNIVALRPKFLAEVCALALGKGIETEFARALVRSRNLPPPSAALHVREWPRPFQVCTLGGFSLLRESRPVEFSGKGPGRPVELLKVLVALGGQNVRSDQLADALWPRVDADYAHKSFTATLHRLRRILDEDDALVLRDARLSLNPRLCWVDTWALDHLVAELDSALREPAARPAGRDVRALAEDALALYRGPFLPDESEQPSYIACREQTRAKLLRCMTRVARRWEETGIPEAAIDCYLRCIDADALCEVYYRNLMLCYHRRGELAEALSTYERLRTVLSVQLKSPPSPETQAVYSSLLALQVSRAAPRE